MSPERDRLVSVLVGTVVGVREDAVEIVDALDAYLAEYFALNNLSVPRRPPAVLDVIAASGEERTLRGDELIGPAARNHDAAVERAQRDEALAALASEERGTYRGTPSILDQYRRDGAPSATLETEAVNLRAALAQCAKWFDLYADHHESQDATEKAQRNRERADFCRAALRRTAPSEPIGVRRPE